MNIAKHLKATQTLIFEWNGEQVEVKVLTNALTPKFAQEMEKSRKEGDLELIQKLSEKIVSWNLDADGADFPPNAANIEILPFSFVEILLNSMTSVWLGNAPKPNPSANLLADSAELQTQTVS